ncbi:hypothetical protein [Microbacterium sp. LWO12-1.2]|uniref:hypothetical protein n=1 Tax=Microbacterium sp. LWO12-1.2 TaxID=3135261 RepID=UPI0034242533
MDELDSREVPARDHDLRDERLYEMSPGVEYFALVDAVASDAVMLDVIDSRDSRLVNSAAARQTSGWFRERWRTAFEAPEVATEVLAALESFEGGLAIVPLAEGTGDWEDWHRQGTWLRVTSTGEAAGRIDAAAVEPDEGRRLHRIFGMTLWPSAEARVVSDAFSDVRALAQTIALDIGQGSANMLVDQQGQARLYFDVGAADGRNARTRPANLPFCVCNAPPVILSHWDTDHWAGAKHETGLLSLTWIAPRQMIGPTHATHGARILQAGGRLLIVKRSSHPRVRVQLASQDIDLAYCSGAFHANRKSNRNDNGLALSIRRQADDLCWIYPGDADYSVMPSFGGSPVVLIASHHGAKQKLRGTPPQRGRRPYARLLYSFGPNNSYGHPHPGTTASHHNQGWLHAGTGAQGPDVLATSRSAGSSSTRGPVAAGWTARPAAQPHLQRAHGIIPTT